MDRQSIIENDEAIARALAHEEQVRADAATSNNSNTNNRTGISNLFPGQRRQQQHESSTVVQGTRVVVNCPGQHGLNEFLVSYSQRARCHICNRTLNSNERAYGCDICKFDVCQRCVSRPPPSFSSAAANGTTQRFPVSLPSPPASVPWQQSYRSNQATVNMCMAPAILGDIMCEMMVDTGAQMSVISIALARRLGLEARIDKTHRGIAAGVGTANIIGQLRNVICSLGSGHVEFPFDFIVLDVKEPLLLLGLDLMRRYKCIVDLERGGSGGVEVPLLPPDEQHIALRNSIGCPIS